ncbi:TPA: hypothetical protein ACQRIM_004727 [Pseudomonas aeruginosa]
MKSTNLALVPTESRPSSMKDRLLDAMSGSFKRLFTEAPDASPHSPGGTAPKVGAYGKPIYYLRDGTVLHSCSVKMKGLYAGIPEISVSPAPVPPRAHPGR